MARLNGVRKAEQDRHQSYTVTSLLLRLYNVQMSGLKSESNSNWSLKGGDMNRALLRTMHLNGCMSVSRLQLSSSDIRYSSSAPYPFIRNSSRTPQQKGFCLPFLNYTRTLCVCVFPSILLWDCFGENVSERAHTCICTHTHADAGLPIFKYEIVFQLRSWKWS